MASGSSTGSKKKNLAKELEYTYDTETHIHYKNLSEYLNAQVEKSTLRQKEKSEEKEKAPKHAKKKKEYVKSTGGHEAMGEGDSGGDGENRKNDHGGGGGGSGGGGGGEKKEKKVYCEKCQELINSNVFEAHLREVHHIFSP